MTFCHANDTRNEPYSYLIGILLAGMHTPLKAVAATTLTTVNVLVPIRPNCGKAVSSDLMVGDGNVLVMTTI